MQIAQQKYGKKVIVNFSRSSLLLWYGRKGKMQFYVTLFDGMRELDRNKLSSDAI
jgi:hypothetical protein